MKTATLILNILCIIGFFPAAFSVLMSPMIFDSGATTRTWVIFITIISIPISIIITQVISWILFSKGIYTWAFGISLIPVALVLLLVILFSISNSLT